VQILYDLVTVNEERGAAKSLIDNNWEDAPSNDT